MSPLLIKLLGGVLVVGSLITWALLERGEKFVAVGKMEIAQADAEQWKTAAQTCSQAVEGWQQASKNAQKDALEARQKAQEEAKKHADEHAVLQTALKRPTPLKGGCDSAWDLIEARK